MEIDRDSVLALRDSLISSGDEGSLDFLGGFPGDPTCLTVGDLYVLCMMSHKIAGPLRTLPRAIPALTRCSSTTPPRLAQTPPKPIDDSTSALDCESGPESTFRCTCVESLWLTPILRQNASTITKTPSSRWCTPSGRFSRRSSNEYPIQYPSS